LRSQLCISDKRIMPEVHMAAQTHEIGPDGQPRAQLPAGTCR
jgi:hypothetical protein